MGAGAGDPVFAAGQLVDGPVGLAVAGLGYGAIVLFGPWRDPYTRYWRLLVVPYFLMFAAVPWAIWSFGPESADALSWWQLLPLLAVLSPFATIGWRLWRDR